MAKSTRTHKTRTEWHSARTEGALDGWDIICTDCGYVGGYSIESLAQRDARLHTENMPRWEAAR